jgi:hypothetical protein
MTDDPLTDQLKMRSIHSYRFWHLFNNDGKPQILWRRRRTITDAKGAKVSTLDVEWGDLDHPSLGVDMKKMFTDAWNEWVEWKKAMA